MPRPQVSADQVGHRVHPRSGHVGHQAGWLAERQFHETGRHLVGVDRLESEAGWDWNQRQLCHLLRHHQKQVIELASAERRPRQPGVGHHTLRGQLGPEVAEHRVVDAADHRDAVGADDRDVHQVAHARAGCCPYQAARLVLVSFGAARQVHDHPDAGHGGLDTLA